MITKVKLEFFKRFPNATFEIGADVVVAGAEPFRQDDIVAGWSQCGIWRCSDGWLNTPNQPNAFGWDSGEPPDSRCRKSDGSEDAGFGSIYRTRAYGWPPSAGARSGPRTTRKPLGPPQ